MNYNETRMNKLLCASVIAEHHFHCWAYHGKRNFPFSKKVDVNSNGPAYVK